MNHLAPLLVAAAAVAAPGALPAQGNDPVTPSRVFVPLEDPAAAPREADETAVAAPDFPLAHKRRRPLPAGTGTLPQPSSPESRATGRPGLTDGPCDLTYFVNRHADVGGPSSFVGEPSVAQVRDTAFVTGNHYALRSLDSGMTWSAVDVHQFPVVDGDFCCDQRALYIPGTDLVIWFLQYKPSSRTLWGGQRIAVANGRGDLRAGANGSWHSWYFRPDSFGHPIKHWLDFPDIAYSNNYLYCASNVYDEFSNWVDSVVWRMSFRDLSAAGGLAVQYVRSSSRLGGDFYRLTQNATSVMYFASLRSSTTVRVFRWPETSGVTSYDVTVPGFTANYVAQTGAGLNWLARADERITGAYYRSGECGFMWHCGIDARNNRPRVFVRTLRFDTARNLPKAVEDLWSSTVTFAYPACTTNAAGDVGCTVATAPTPGDPTSASFIVDGCAPGFAGQTVVHHAQATHGPRAAEWGDYFSLQRHPTITSTFVTTGMTLRGGNSTANMEPRFAWFGRESNTPRWVKLDVSSTPVSGAAIAVRETDRLGNRHGTTPFQREFAPRQGYQLRAPTTITTRTAVYDFVRWRINGTAMPRGQIVFESPDIGTVDDVAVAEYAARRTLAVRSRNPASGVPIGLSAPDVNGRQNGQTPFDRVYLDGSIVTLTAPSSYGNAPFKYWVVGGVPQPAGQASLPLVVNGNRTVIAEYAIVVTGSYRTIGTGCPGSSGVPSLGGTNTPAIGGEIAYLLSGAPPNTGATLILGISDQIWNGTPLPLSLAIVGMGGTCQLWVSVEDTLSRSTDLLGRATVRLPLPNSPDLVGASLFSEALVFDPKVATTTKLVATNGVEAVIGGIR